MGPRRCYLCNRERSNEIALHRIPKDPETSAAWVEFCKLNVIYDDISKVEICSNHFDIKDFINSKAKEFGGKLRLKFGAVPSTSISRNLFKMDPIQARPNLPLLVPGPSYSGVARSCSQSEDIPSSRSDVEIEPTTPKRKRFSQPRYVGEIKSPHLVTPRRAKRMFSLASKKIDLQAKKIKILQQKNRRLVKKVKKLDDLVNHLKKKNLISENCADFMMTDLPESLKEVISQKLQKRKSTQYSPELRKFALTLQFYSSTAYNYVRRVWRNLLPHPSTIRKWYSVVDGKPGFSKEAFKAISVRNEHSIIHMNIVLDEMSIRSQLLYADGTFYGGVDLGTNMPKESDMLTEATNALVFLAVGLNGHWKVPLGYFLIQGLSGTERANLLVKCFELLGETGAKVFSITFDGAPVNFNMCNQLGANFDIFQMILNLGLLILLQKTKFLYFGMHVTC